LSYFFKFSISYIIRYISAHEYTAANAKFASSVEPGNVDLMNRVKEVNEIRKNRNPTVPTNLGMEKKTNPFLRCDFSKEIQRNVGAATSDTDADIFGKLRRAKDNFRG
jgi:hydroxyacylglutathione hydrolase